MITRLRHFRNPLLSGPYPKPALKNDFRNRNQQKNGANDCVQTEEGNVDPVEASSAGDPML